MVRAGLLKTPENLRRGTCPALGRCRPQHPRLPAYLLNEELRCGGYLARPVLFRRERRLSGTSAWSIPFAGTSLVTVHVQEAP